jgi:PmbA protein
MKREFITLREKETTIKVQNTKINAVRMKDILKKGVRVFDQDSIGVAGAIGDMPQEELLANARQNLGTKISYPYPLTRGKDHRSYNQNPISPEDLLAYSEEVLATLRADFADFDFSESIKTKEIIKEMQNDEGLDLRYQDAYYYLGLVLKEKKSANLYDGFLGCHGRQLNLPGFWSFTRELLEAYRRPTQLPEGEVLPVFTFDIDTLTDFLGRALNGERYATGSSLYSGKLGEQLFAEKITLEQNRSPLFDNTPFFDQEGVVLPEDRHALISGGKLVSVFTDKRNAALYNLPHTGAAGGDYDGIPSLTTTPLAFQSDTPDLQSALKSPAILSMVSSGGDFTPDGSYAAPVQVAFLFDGERIIGKLPEFTVRSHISKMLGQAYIGTFDNTRFYLGDMPSQLQGYYMTIVR